MKAMMQKVPKALTIVTAH